MAGKGMLRLTAAAALFMGASSMAKALPLTIEARITERSVYEVAGNAPISVVDSAFSPFTFQFTFDVAEEFEMAVGPSTQSRPGSGNPYEYTYAAAHFASSFSLAMLPFASELDSYRTYSGALQESSGAAAESDFTDYLSALSGTDRGLNFASFGADEIGSGCIAGVCSGYQQRAGFWNIVPGADSSAAVLIPTFADFLDTLSHAQGSVLILARDISQTCGGIAGCTYSRYAGVEYSGSFRITPVSVPEPGIASLFVLALAGLGLTRRRVKR